MQINRLTPESDFSHIASSIIPKEWSEANDFSPLSEEALRKIAGDESYVFLLAIENEKVIGTALAILLQKPDGSSWLYVDELDTHPDHLRKGVATSLMKWLLTFAKQKGASEVWLGTEPENTAANALYRSLNLSEVSSFVGYTYELE